MNNKWYEEVSEKTREILFEIGAFSPTTKGNELKGWLDKEKTYLNSNDLREYAAAMLEAAAWLDRSKTF